ncbi:unnamed protein product [Closterium sp. Naga37s-1]|nr:unnamed protein product [Closterium sp. Naga37s-1]
MNITHCPIPSLIPSSSLLYQLPPPPLSYPYPPVPSPPPLLLPLHSLSLCPSSLLYARISLSAPLSLSQPPLSLSRPFFPYLCHFFPLFGSLSLSLPLLPSICLSFPLFASLSLSLPLLPSLCLSFPLSASPSLSLPLFPTLCLSFPLVASLSLSLPLLADSCARHPHPITLNLLAGDLLHALERFISVLLGPDELLVPVRHEHDGMSNVGALGEVDDEGQHLHHGTGVGRRGGIEGGWGARRADAVGGTAVGFNSAAGSCRADPTRGRPCDGGENEGSIQDKTAAGVCRMGRRQKQQHMHVRLGTCRAGGRLLSQTEQPHYHLACNRKQLARA